MQTLETITALHPSDSPPQPSESQNPAAPIAPAEPEPRSHSTGRKRRGKVARLPKSIRDQINSMLDDGLSYSDIIESLTAPAATPLPYPITEHHLSEWKAGGYQDYSHEQLWRDQILDRAESFSGLATEDAISLPEGGLQLATLHICELLRDLSRLESSPDIDPNQLVRIAHALSRLSRSIVHLHQYREVIAQARAALKPMMDPRRELTDDERHAIVRHVDRILGIDQYKHDFENQIPSLGIIRPDKGRVTVNPEGRAPATPQSFPAGNPNSEFPTPHSDGAEEEDII